MIDGLTFPTNMAFAPDGRLFFTEKDTGSVRVIVDGRLRPRPFASFDVINEGETGLLGIALHPEFEREPWVYLYLSDAETRRNIVVRLRDEDGVGRGRQDVIALLTAQNGYHNGGDLLFGSDGLLYVAVGEVHEPDRAQVVSDLGGKILRLEPDGSVPADNPFGPKNPAYTMGHRNSFGLCVDPEKDRIWETENGPEADDEVNLLRPGRNYGWPLVTGFAPDDGFEPPLSVFPDTIALTGCVVWRGDLYVGAFLTGAVYRISSEGTAERVASFPAGVTDLQVGPDDRLYVATAEAIHALGRIAEPSSGE